MEDMTNTQSSNHFDEKSINLGGLQLSAPLGIGTWAWGDNR
jgi:hypothetical protein